MITRTKQYGRSRVVADILSRDKPVCRTCGGPVEHVIIDEVDSGNLLQATLMCHGRREIHLIDCDKIDELANAGRSWRTQLPAAAFLMSVATYGKQTRASRRERRAMFRR